MKITLSKTPLAQTAADAVVVGIFSDGKTAERAAAEADRATDGLLSKLIERKEITGKKYELVPLLAPSGIAAEQMLVIGLGDRNNFDAGTAYRAAAAAAKQLAGKPRKTVAYFLGDAKAEQTENAVAGAIVGCQGQDIYRAEKKRHPFEEILWDGSDEGTIRRGTILGESINLTRRLVNEPPQDMYPESFAARAAEVAKTCALECEIWDQATLEQERCGSLLAVARGSSRPARLVILRYRGCKKDDPLLALVG
ncbi:MAG TPA: M17 family peptidase N-terminal domain-containing protein, partial [Pirellulales bacterium]